MKTPEEIIDEARLAWRMTPELIADLDAAGYAIVPKALVDAATSVVVNYGTARGISEAIDDLIRALPDDEPKAARIPHEGKVS